MGFGRKKEVEAPPAPPTFLELAPAEQALAAALILGGLACVWVALKPRPRQLDYDHRTLSRAASWRLLSVLAFALNVFAVSLPGRFDGEAAAAANTFPWDTLFAPAPWAFAIWGAIYAGEALGLAAALLANRDDAHADGDEGPRGPAFVAANVAQSLWCAAFRPWALGLLWLPAALLACTAACLACSQVRAPKWRGAEELPWGTSHLVTLPRSLHCGWTAAAALVNLNACLGTPALAAAVAPNDVYAAAHGSAFLGGLAGAFLALAAGLPAAALALAWGLYAVSQGTPVGAAAAAVGPAALHELSRFEAHCAAYVLGAAAVATLIGGGWSTGRKAWQAQPPSASRDAAARAAQAKMGVLSAASSRPAARPAAKPAPRAAGSGAGKAAPASAAPVCAVAVVGCGLPGRGMGWYHALNVLDGQVKGARLTDIVEPWFLGPVGSQGPDGAAFAAFRKEVEQTKGVRFHVSVKDMPKVSGGAVKKVALIAGRTADNPRLLEECIDRGCSTVYLEKPGAPTVGELEAMAASAAAKGVKVYMGYNKNVTKYVVDALAAEARAGPGATTAFYHNNAYQKAELPECFERNAEGMLKNMAVHELALLVTFYGVRADNIKSIVPDKTYSSCQTLTAPTQGRPLTDMDKVGFTVTTTAGKTVSVYADRCGDAGGGGFAEAVVKDAKGKVVFTSKTPDAALQAVVAAKQKAHPSWMPYFHLQHDDYITLKERVCAATLGGTEPEGVASIGVAIETLKLAEHLTPTLTKALLKRKSFFKP